MKRRLLSVIVSLCLTLCCLPTPALGVETAGFSDVEPEDWFAPYVEVCVEEGLMEGTGDGKFEPQKELSLAEVMVLAARLYSQVMEEDIPPVPLGEELEPDDVLVQLWPFFVDAKDLPERELSPAERIAAMNQSEQESMTDFLDQLTADPAPYSWYLNEVYYLWDLSPTEMERLLHRLKWQEGTAADTPALRDDFGDLLGQLTPSPIVVHAPEQGSAITSQGAWILILTGVMEGTGEGYALDKGLTRAECAALLARMMRPGLRKAPAVEPRQPKELTGLEVWHGSFGQIEVQYTLDLEAPSLSVWYPDTFGREEETQESFPLSPAAAETFRQSPGLEKLLGWGPVYYNMGVFDGHQWGVSLTFSDGTTREIAGSNAYPEGWDLVYDALLELTGKNVMDARMYAATWMHI